MNGIPNHSLLKNLVYLALVAFGLTVIALINARSAKNILPLFVRFPQRLFKHIIFHHLAVPIIRRLAARRKHEDQEKRNESDPELCGCKLEPAMYQSAVMASSHGLPAAATTASPPILVTPDHPRQDPHLDGQMFERVRSMRPPKDWQEKYQDILHFSFLRAVRKEERKQNQVRIQEKTVQTQKPGRFSLKGLIYRQKRDGDVEQGDDTDNKTESAMDSGQLAIWPAEFSGIDESLFDDSGVHV